jgi:hypothetical protein
MLGIIDKVEYWKECRTVYIYPHALGLNNFYDNLNYIRGVKSPLLPCGEIEIHVPIFKNTGIFKHQTKNKKGWTLGMICSKAYDDILIMSRWDAVTNVGNYVDKPNPDGSSFYAARSIIQLYIDAMKIKIHMDV